MTDATWAKPTGVDAATRAFPASVMGSLLPDMDDIPEEFKRQDGTPWNELASKWFFAGLKKAPVFKPGIDASAAMGHLKACLGSYEPKHEHKEAGVAYLMSLWCEPVTQGGSP